MLFRQLACMPRLQVLNLSGCHLDGILPSATFAALPQLRSLDLTNNQLAGPLPASLGACRRLEVIRLSFNNLSGT